MDKITALKSQYDIREEYQRISQVDVNRNNQGPCVYCKSSDAFTVYEDSFYCYSCDNHGDVIDLLAWERNQTVSDFIRGNDINMTPQEIEQRSADIAARELKRKEDADRNYKNAIERLSERRAWIRYAENLRNSQNAQQLWRARGISEEWQAYFELGYSENFKYIADGIGRVTTKTLAIPFKKIGGDVVMIQHRILNAPDGSRYRPDQSGLKMEPFICNTEISKADEIVLVEGAIKSMVSFITYDARKIQFIGAVSKGEMKKLIEKTAKRNVIVIPDPDSIDELIPLCRLYSARVLVTPDKVDDWILQENISTREFRSIVSQARRI